LSQRPSHLWNSLWHLPRVVNTIAMMEPQTSTQFRPSTSSWSHRILIAAVIGIFFLTLYPFRFSLVRHGPAALTPYLLGGWGKDAGVLDVFLNIALFIPYGFGLAEEVRERGRSRAAAFGVTLIAGALLSYTVEFLQFYIPMRDSGWNDVITNSAGSVVGFLLYELGGTAILRSASRIESFFVGCLSWRRLIASLLLYLGVWLAISIHLQRGASVSDWLPNAMLLINNSSSEVPAPPWQGKVVEFDFWDRALGDSAARAITSSEQDESLGLVPLTSYNLTGEPPFRDRCHFLPDLAWMPDSGLSSSRAEKLWLISRAPISPLVSQVQHTNQFSFRVIFQAGAELPENSVIVSIAEVPGLVNMELRQEYSHLVFRFRNPLLVKHPRLALDLPKVFPVSQTRNILLSYDGSRLYLYIDGRKDIHFYSLGPGAGLAQFLLRIKPAELEGCRDIFYLLVFFPAGCLLGLGWRRFASQVGLRLLFFFTGALLLSTLFEISLTLAAGLSVGVGSIVASALLIFAGIFWVNADVQKSSP
jgi:VanZ like family